MAKKANSKLIGGFVVGAITLIIVGALTFGGGQFLKPTQKFILFFQGSLTGLDVGSPVTFRGVKVGSVTGVVIEYDIAKQVLHVPVHIELQADKIRIVSGERNPTKNINELIARGLRAQLETVSLVTGQTAVNFDFHPGAPLRLVSTEAGIQEIPTIPSNMQALEANITSVLQKVSMLPLDKFSEQISEALTSVNQLVQQAGGTLKGATNLIDNVNTQVKPLTTNVMATSDQANLMLQEARKRVELKPGEPLQNLNNVLADAGQLVNGLNKDLPAILGPAVKALAQTSVAVDQAVSLLAAAQRFISPSSPIFYELSATLTEFKGAARAFRVLAEYLQRNPSAMLTGNK